MCKKYYLSLYIVICIILPLRVFASTDGFTCQHYYNIDEIYEIQVIFLKHQHDSLVLDLKLFTRDKIQPKTFETIAIGLKGDVSITIDPQIEYFNTIENKWITIPEDPSGELKWINYVELPIDILSYGFVAQAKNYRNNIIAIMEFMSGDGFSQLDNKSYSQIVNVPIGNIPSDYFVFLPVADVRGMRIRMVLNDSIKEGFTLLLEAKPTGWFTGRETYRFEFDRELNIAHALGHKKKIIGGGKFSPKINEAVQEGDNACILTENIIKTLFPSKVKRDSRNIGVFDLKWHAGHFLNYCTCEAVVLFKNPSKHYTSDSEVWLLRKNDTWRVDRMLLEAGEISFEIVDIEGDGIFEILLRAETIQGGYQCYRTIIIAFHDSKPNELYAKEWEIYGNIPPEGKIVTFDYNIELKDIDGDSILEVNEVQTKNILIIENLKVLQSEIIKNEVIYKFTGNKFSVQ